MTFGKAWKHQVLHIKLANLRWQGLAGITYLNIFYLKCFWRHEKHRVLMTFEHKIEESGLSGGGRNNIFEYLLFEITFGNAWIHQVVHVKRADLHWHGWARIMYLNIFYLKCLWEGIKTPSCGEVCIKLKNRGFQEWAGKIYLNIFYLKWLLARHENTKSCT